MGVVEHEGGDNELGVEDLGGHGEHVAVGTDGVVRGVCKNPATVDVIGEDNEDGRVGLRVRDATRGCCRTAAGRTTV